MNEKRLLEMMTERRSMKTYPEIETYPEMNTKIVWLLRMTKDNPVCMYAAARIEELEAKQEQLREACEALDAAFMPNAQAFDTLAIWAARDKARAALKQAKGEQE